MGIQNCLYFSSNDESQNMDPLEVDIFKKILSSCSDVWNDISSKDEWKTLQESNRFPIIADDVLNGFVTSLVNLLCHKVSHALEQRYEVRLRVIEILRSWSRLKGSLTNLSTTLLNGENATTFVVSILEKYLTDDLLNTTKSVEPLMTLYRSLIHLLPKNPSLLQYSHKIILRLAELDLTEESEKLLLSIFESKENLEIDEYLLEQILVSQKIKFIEIPLKNAFLKNFSKLSNTNDELTFEQDLNKIYDRIVHSSLIFRLTCSLLNEIFLASNHSQEALNFIKIILDCINNRCKDCGIDMVELYPINLQSCVILLRIEPNNHTESSRNYVLNELKNIFLTNNQDAVILVSHFPAWLEIFKSFLVDNECDLN